MTTSQDTRKMILRILLDGADDQNQITITRHELAKLTKRTPQNIYVHLRNFQLAGLLTKEIREPGGKATWTVHYTADEIAA